MKLNRGTMHPFISVIVPLYNKESSIRRTIQSVLCQSICNFEIVVVNDGSTDNSVDVVRAINDDRIILINQSNGGPSKARNTGVSHSSGEWVFFLDADDELLPNAFDNFNALSERYPAISCFAYNFVIKGNGSERRFYNSSSIKVFKNPFIGWCEMELFPRAGVFFTRKNVLVKYKFRNDLRRYEDAEWAFRIMRDEFFVRSPFPILLYNTDYAAASGKRANISEDFLGHLDFKEKCIWEQVALYQLLNEARELYPEDSERLYSQLPLRVSRLICIKILLLYCSLFRKVMNRVFN